MIKATPTVEVVYENVTDLDDIVINITVTGKEGAPKISWAATAATPFKIFVNNETYKVKISNGVGSVTIPNLPAGEYVINASWDGNTRYNGIEPQLYNLLVTPLKGTYTDLQAQIDAADGVFVKALSATIYPMRAYLTCKNASPVYGLGKVAAEETLPDVINVRFLDKNGGTLSIGTMNTRTGDIQMQDRYYDLKGRKLNGKPQNKIMYVNKKVIKH